MQGLDNYGVVMEHGIHNLLRNRALFAFGACGVAGILVDVDHIPYIIGVVEDGRFLHPRFFLVGCFGCALFGGYLVLNRIMVIYRSSLNVQVGKAED
jgi:hypothetical protein